MKNNHLYNFPEFSHAKTISHIISQSTIRIKTHCITWKNWINGIISIDIEYIYWNHNDWLNKQISIKPHRRNTCESQNLGNKMLKTSFVRDCVYKLELGILKVDCLKTISRIVIHLTFFKKDHLSKKLRFRE